MGVSHLRQHADRARRSQINNGTDDARSISTPLSTRPNANSGDNDPEPQGAVKSFSRAALKPSNKAAQPEHGGARAGAKSGQPSVGKRTNAYPTSGGKLN